jgi:hypothetical protein
MTKRGPNHPIPGHFKVQGGPVEDRDRARASKQAVGRQEARKRRRAGRKTTMGEAPPEQRAKEPPKPHARPSAKVPAEAHHPDEYARMNERRTAPKQARRAVELREDEAAEHPIYLTDVARGVLRRVARYALAPVSLARAVVGRWRHRD